MFNDVSQIISEVAALNSYVISVHYGPKEEGYEEAGAKKNIYYIVIKI